MKLNCSPTFLVVAAITFCLFPWSLNHLSLFIATIPITIAEIPQIIVEVLVKLVQLASLGVAPNTEHVVKSKFQLRVIFCRLYLLFLGGTRTTNIVT